MIALIENILLALTDAQFDKVLAMIERGFLAIAAAVKAAWSLFVPLIGAWVAFKCQQILKNQKSNREALDKNTELTETSKTQSETNLQEIADLKNQIKQLKAELNNEQK